MLIIYKTTVYTILNRASHDISAMWHTYSGMISAVSLSDYNHDKTPDAHAVFPFGRMRRCIQAPALTGNQGLLGIRTLFFRRIGVVCLSILSL